MDLEQFAASREQHEIVQLPIPDKELCDRFEQVFTAAVNDVLRELGLVYQTLPNSILPLKDEMKVAGIAFTVKGSKNLTLTSEMEQRAQMLEALHEDSVCVWDTSGDDESAQWGEIMTMASKRRGCRGAIVDGGVRDTDKVLEQDFPVFCKYKTSNGMLGRFRMIGWQMPVKLGDVMIFPGDVILGDIDGVIVIPRKLAYDVLLKAEYIKENEKDIKQMIVDGLTPTEVVKRGGYF
ncbi:RraA family protein [Paenibacillus shunpengii]|uniref:Putative 4-hydroxy-4-methyl-2-oxoglutarate aldolase n=1 Tax=Paenibacillus shunpengii TaxID=2054424 RepID=A0ABW5SRF2_9BACL|nr:MULTISPECIES: RraA family protein [unclassified Paenibacillus]OMC65429.1 dimethylmenaquinone methyltransferase [Paenibacillus sp. FSL H7-0326]SDX19569.1 Regulator of RNase E activity RraA [Paenibacillus sp. PDC88]